MNKANLKGTENKMQSTPGENNVMKNKINKNNYSIDN